MDFLYITFEISGVKTWLFVPPVVAFAVSFFTSMGGVSGAFMLLPFQMSILHYTAPSVSGTNQLFNIVAIPSGVWCYIKEKRMLWSLAWIVVVGTLPGVFIGVWIRLEYLPDPKNFKFFAGLVLLYVGIRLFIDTLKTIKLLNKDKTTVKEKNPASQTAAADNKKSNKKEKQQASIPQNFIVADTHFSLKKVEFRFGGEKFSFSVPGVFTLCFIIGIVGGIYGIGGGAIAAPFFVAFFHLPVYAVAGAALMGTFMTSIAGVAAYQILSKVYTQVSVAPDWFLGTLFGIGGFCGMYLGARCQKYVPAHKIKFILCFCVMFISIKYIFDFIK